MVRLYDQNGDGVADAAPQVLADHLPPELTDVRLAGNLVLVTSAREQDVSPILAALRRTGFHAPTLVLTQGMSLQMRQRALALGVVDVIALPLDTRVLQALYSFDPKSLPVYVGQQMDVFIEAPPLRSAEAARGSQH